MRKSILTMTLLAGFALMSCAQGTKAPAAVTEAFKAKFPTAKDVKWDKENDKEWEAEFKMNGEEYSANFSATGEWLETEFEIKASELPDTIKSSIQKNFASYKIDEAEKAEKKSGIVYEVILKKNDKEIEVVFDSSGKVISQKEIQDDDDKE